SSRVTTSPAPDDHFTTSPNRCVAESPGGRVRRIGGSPSVCAWIVSPASVQTKVKPFVLQPAPDNHFTAGPDGRMNVSYCGCICGACSRPTIRCGIISSAGVHSLAVVPAPYNHFTASPDCSVTHSWRRVVSVGTRLSVY